MSNEKLTVLWTSGERDVALKVVLRYVENVVNNQLWPSIDLLIWGPSVQLAADDDNIKLQLENMIAKGVKVKACIVCADEYGVNQMLDDIGVELTMVSDELTHIIQEQKPLLSL